MKGFTVIYDNAIKVETCRSFMPLLHVYTAKVVLWLFFIGGKREKYGKAYLRSLRKKIKTLFFNFFIRCLFHVFN